MYKCVIVESKKRGIVCQATAVFLDGVGESRDIKCVAIGTDTPLTIAIDLTTSDSMKIINEFSKLLCSKSGSYMDIDKILNGSNKCDIPLC